jgi:CheY-like chemotaxis protein
LLNLNLLIIEDHPFQRSMLEQLVRGLGAQAVSSVADGSEAMRWLRDSSAAVDVVISDLMMPRMDGIELLPILRKACPEAALVLVSADENVLPAAQTIAKAHGITVLGAICKPVTVAKLKPLLEGHAARPRPPAEPG